MNRHRYRALVDIAVRLDSFRKMHITSEHIQAIYDAFNGILKSLQREMGIILAADASDSSWGLIREMHNQLSTVDLQLQEMLTKAEGVIKKRLKEGRGSKQPFRTSCGGSVATRSASSFPHLQLLIGDIGQITAAGQQQSIQLGDGGVPTAYTTVYPWYQGARPRCFNCQQTGHFQKSCLLGPRPKQGGQK